jgi:hypothetical protein
MRVSEGVRLSTLNPQLSTPLEAQVLNPAGRCLSSAGQMKAVSSTRKVNQERLTRTHR